MLYTTNMVNHRIAMCCGINKYKQRERKKREREKEEGRLQDRALNLST